MESRSDEALAAGDAGGASGAPPAERGSDAAAAAAEPQASSGRPEEGHEAPAAPAAAPAATGATDEACTREVPARRGAAPAGVDDDGDAGPDSPADFFGFFVDVHKNLAKELGDEFQRIPEASGKICTRLGLPICAQMRSAITKGDAQTQTPASPASPPPPQKA